MLIDENIFPSLPLSLPSLPSLPPYPTVGKGWAREGIGEGMGWVKCNYIQLPLEI